MNAAKTSGPLPGLAGLSMVGLIGTGLGFLGAGVDPGPGPRTVKGSLTVAHLYLPPLVVGLVALAMAGLVVTRIRWMPVVGGLFACILLVGAATFGSASVHFRLTHPAAVIGFTEDSIQVVGEVIAIGAGCVTAVQFVQRRLTATSNQRPTSKRDR